MTTILQKLTAFFNWLFRNRSENPVRSTQLELEHARAGFEDAGRRVEFLTGHLDRARTGGEVNRGQLAIMQRDLKQAACNAQAAFDRALQIQDDLSVLQAARIGGDKISRVQPIPRAELEALLKKVALSDSQAEQYRDVMQELQNTVYGVSSSDLENLPILAKESTTSAPAPKKTIRVEPFITNG